MMGSKGLGELGQDLSQLLQADTSKMTMSVNKCSGETGRAECDRHGVFQVACDD